jgi:hypothetical protein
LTYLFLIYSDPDRPAGTHDDAARPALAADEFGLECGGSVLMAEALHPPHSATTVRLRDGALHLSDGPCAPAGEQLTALYLVTARDLNQAIRVAARLPPAQFGSIEIRTVRDRMRPAPHTGSA